MNQTEMIEEICWMKRKMGEDIKGLVDTFSDKSDDQVQTEYDFVSDEYESFSVHKRLSRR